MQSPTQSRTTEELSPRQVQQIRFHLHEVLASPAFAGSKRAQSFLQLVVGHALDGDYDSLRERMIGAEMFGRPVDYDTGSDSVVRVKATEVRKKLQQFYLESPSSQVRIELPSGSYVPKFGFSSVEVPEPPLTAAAADSVRPPWTPEEPVMDSVGVATEKNLSVRVPRWRRVLGAVRADPPYGLPSPWSRWLHFLQCVPIWRPGTQRPFAPSPSCRSRIFRGCRRRITLRTG